MVAVMRFRVTAARESVGCRLGQSVIMSAACQAGQLAAGGCLNLWSGLTWYRRQVNQLSRYLPSLPY